MSKRKLEATRANQARKAGESRRLPPGAKVPRQRPSMPSWVWAAVGGVVVVIVAVVAFLALRGGSDSGPKPIVWGDLPGLQSGPVPWTEGLDQLQTRLDKIGLKALPA